MSRGKNLKKSWGILKLSPNWVSGLPLVAADSLHSPLNPIRLQLLSISNP